MSRHRTGSATRTAPTIRVLPWAPLWGLMLTACGDPAPPAASPPAPAMGSAARRTAGPTAESTAESTPGPAESVTPAQAQPSAESQAGTQDATPAATTEPFRLVLPDGRAARAWAGVGPETLPIPPAAELASALEGTDPWSSAAAWRLWGRVLREEAAAAQPSPARRAALCLFARSQGRARDAWNHFASLADAPGHAAGTAAYLFPGVPLGTPLGPGGAPLGLAEGTLLTPLVPPDPDDLPAGAFAWSEMTVTDLAVGEALLNVTLSVESTGVEFEAGHAGGEETRLRVLLPSPRGYPIRLLYLDYELQAEEPVELAFTIGPDDEEERTLWGRTLEDLPALPKGRPGPLPAVLREGGLWLEVEAGDAQAELLGTVAEVLGELLEVEAGVRPPAAPGGPARPGLGMPLGAAASRSARLAYLVSSLESQLLSNPEDR